MWVWNDSHLLSVGRGCSHPVKKKGEKKKEDKHAVRRTHFNISELHWLSPQWDSCKHSHTHRNRKVTQCIMPNGLSGDDATAWNAESSANINEGVSPPWWCQSCFDSAAPGVKSCYEPVVVCQSATVAQIQRMTSKYCWGPSAPLRAQRYGQPVICILQQQESGYWQPREDQLTVGVHSTYNQSDQEAIDLGH